MIIEYNFIEATSTYSNSSEQTKFRLNEINKVKEYFNLEIQKRKQMTKKLSKYIAAFDYFNKTLIILFSTCWGVSIISFVSDTGAPLGIASASFSLAFSLTTKIIKKLLKITRNKKKKQNKIVMLDRKKLDNIEKLVSQALIDLEIIHEEYKLDINGEDNYRRIRENIRWWKVMMKKMN